MTETPLPDVTIIIPIFQQWSYLGDLASCLQAQEVPADTTLQIILINNGAPGDTEGFDNPHKFELHHCAEPGSYAARNFGLKFARAPVVLFTDADCLPEPAWVARILRAIRSDRGPVLAGDIQMIYSDKRSIWEAYDMIRGIPQAAYVKRGYATTANLAVLRPVIDALGGFDDSYFSGGDADFCRRAGQLGHRIAFVPDAVVLHRSRKNAAEVMSKHRRLIGGLFRQQRHLPWRAFGHTVAPPLLTIGSLLRRRNFALNDRLKAALVAAILWLAGIREAVRLMRGKHPARK